MALLQSRSSGPTLSPQSSASTPATFSYWLPDTGVQGKATTPQSKLHHQLITCLLSRHFEATCHALEKADGWTYTLHAVFLFVLNNGIVDRGLPHRLLVDNASFVPGPCDSHWSPPESRGGRRRQPLHTAIAHCTSSCRIIQPPYHLNNYAAWPSRESGINQHADSSPMTATLCPHVPRNGRHFGCCRFRVSPTASLTSETALYRVSL